MNYTELMKQLSENIIRAVRSLIKTAPYDQTYKAKITEVVSATKVKIELNRQIHTATTSVSCEVGDIVIVCVPRNNWNDLYVEQNKTRGRASGIVAIDESGLLGSAGKSVNAQELINVMADKIATQLLLKTDVISQIIDDATKAASMAALYSVNQKVDKVNSDLESGRVRGSEYDGTVNIGNETWYCKHVNFAKQRDRWPIIVTGYNSSNDSQDGLFKCFVKNMSYTGFTMVFQSSSGNAYYIWAVIK